MSTQKTVFVVDDDEAAAASVAALMMSIGLAVETFHSAEDFLSSINEHQSGCLVLDVRLGGMDGLTLQKQLVGRGSTLPIVIISGHADRELSEKAISNGAVAFFEKPFHGQQLCHTVQTLLAQQ